MEQPESHRKFLIQCNGAEKSGWTHRPQVYSPRSGLFPRFKLTNASRFPGVPFQGGSGVHDDPPRHRSLSDLRDAGTLAGEPRESDGWGCQAGGDSDRCGEPSFSGSLDDLQDIVPEEDGKYITITGAQSDDETELVKTAWAMLKQNYDLVEWANCWVTGDRSAGCLFAYFFSFLPLPIIKIYRETDNNYDKWCNGWKGAAWTFKRPHTVYLCTRASAWKKWMGAWTNGKRPEFDRYCAALNLSATILHEMLHLCWRSPNDDPENCEVTYLVASTYQWAMLHRYPDLQRSACCEGFSSELDAMFMSDSSWTISCDCIWGMCENPGSSLWLSGQTSDPDVNVDYSLRPFDPSNSSPSGQFSEEVATGRFYDTGYGRLSDFFSATTSIDSIPDPRGGRRQFISVQTSNLTVD